MHVSLGRVKLEEDKETIEHENNYAVQAVNRGFAAIAMEQRYMGEVSGVEDGRACVHNRALPALLAGKCAIGQRVWDVMRLIDVLESSFSQYFSVENLVCMGRHRRLLRRLHGPAHCHGYRLLCLLHLCRLHRRHAPLRLQLHSRHRPMV